MENKLEELSIKYEKTVELVEALEQQTTVILYLEAIKQREISREEYKKELKKASRKVFDECEHLLILHDDLSKDCLERGLSEKGIDSDTPEAEVANEYMAEKRYLNGKIVTHSWRYPQDAWKESYRKAKEEYPDATQDDIIYHIKNDLATNYQINDNSKKLVLNKK